MKKGTGGAGLLDPFFERIDRQDTRQRCTSPLTGCSAIRRWPASMPLDLRGSLCGFLPVYAGLPGVYVALAALDVATYPADQAVPRVKDAGEAVGLAAQRLQRPCPETTDRLTCVKTFASGCVCV